MFKFFEACIRCSNFANWIYYKRIWGKYNWLWWPCGLKGRLPFSTGQRQRLTSTAAFFSFDGKQGFSSRPKNVLLLYLFLASSTTFCTVVAYCSLVQMQYKLHSNAFHKISFFSKINHFFRINDTCGHVVCISVYFIFLNKPLKRLSSIHLQKCPVMWQKPKGSGLLGGSFIYWSYIDRVRLKTS